MSINNKEMPLKSKPKVDISVKYRFFSKFMSQNSAQRWNVKTNQKPM